MNDHRERVAAFVETLAKEMLAFCGPIFITPGLRTYPEQMIDNGTYSLIDTGQRRLLVTCHHVWQAYLDCRTKNPDAALCINLGDGTASIAFALPERQLIDADADLDLAVFNFEPSQIRVNKSQINHQKNRDYALHKDGLKNGSFERPRLILTSCAWRFSLAWTA